MYKHLKIGSLKNNSLVCIHTKIYTTQLLKTVMEPYHLLWQCRSQHTSKSGHTEEFGYYPTTFGGGGVGQGKSHCTRQIAQGYLQRLWVTLNLHRYKLGFPIAYYVHYVKNDLHYVWSGMNSLVEWAVRGVDNECTFLWAMKQLVSV